MAAAIEHATGVKPDLIQGGGGIFDVKVDDELIYSRHETGQFPSNDEILAMLRAM